MTSPEGPSHFVYPFARRWALGLTAPLGDRAPLCLPRPQGRALLLAAGPRLPLGLTSTVLLTILAGPSFRGTLTSSSRRTARFSGSPAVTWGTRGGTNVWPSAQQASRRRTSSSESTVSPAPAPAARQASLGCPLRAGRTRADAWASRRPAKLSGRDVSCSPGPRPCFASLTLPDNHSG